MWESGALKSNVRKTWPSQLQKRKEMCPSCAFLPHSELQWISWGWISLLSLLVQMLIFSTNILTDTPRNKDLPAFLASFSPVKLTQKNNHYTHHYILEADNSLLGLTGSQVERHFGSGWLVSCVSPIPDLDGIWMRFWTESCCWNGLRLMRMLGWDVNCILHVRKIHELLGARG